MVVQHNMQAANANRMLNVTTSAQSKSTEKDAAGRRHARRALRHRGFRGGQVET